MSEWDAFPAVDAPRQNPQPAPRRVGGWRRAPQVQFADDNDALIRTVIGEARGESPEGRLAVAAVIRNRARQRGLSPSQVVLEPNQFEPWGNAETAQGLMSIRPDDPLYREVAAQIASDQDPTGGASHFYAPKAQAALGRDKPSWDNGTGRAIGNHLFFNLDGQPADDVQLIGQPQDEDFSAFEAVDAMPEEASSFGPQLGARDNPIDITDRNQVIQAKKGDWVRLENGDLTRAAGSAVEGTTDEQRAPGIFTRTTNLGDAIGAGAMAAAEQIPFLDESVAFTTGLLSGEGYQAMRDRQEALKQLDNEQNRGARVAGGVAGFGTGLLAPGGAWVGRGATAGQRIARGGLLGAGYGGLYGAGAAEDGERIEGAQSGALMGAVAGGVGQGLLDRLTAGAARRAANPSPARVLSREGVDLTPGQMVESLPVVGPLARKAEDNVTGLLPFVQSARDRGVESFNIASLNRALAPIGESLPKNTQAGYDAVGEVQRRLGAAYDDVLPRISSQLDRPLYDDLAEILNQAASDMPQAELEQLGRTLQNRVFRNVDQADATISGEQFKRIESELGSLSRQYRAANDPAKVAFANAVDDVRSALRDNIARHNPKEADRLRKINEGYSNLVRVERAAGTGAAQGRDGVFLPGELSTATRAQATRSELARGAAPMQDLASAARQVLPNQTGDSGTASRGVMAGLLGGAIIAPKVAVPIIASSLAYSRPAQKALNAIYRATDSSSGRKALKELYGYAQRNPALVPVYERALEHVLQQPSPDTQAGSPARAGLLSPTPA